MKPRVLLVNPPLLLEREFIDYPYFGVLGVLSNAAALRVAGFEVEVADAFSGPDSGAERTVDGRLLAGGGAEALLGGVAGEPEAVVVAVPPFLKPHVPTPFASALFTALRARFPGARLIAADCYFGGMHYIEYDGEAFLRRHPELDALVKYEGEAELPELLSRPSGPRLRLGRAAGVDYERLPPPAWDLIAVPRYQAFLARFFGAAGRPSVFAGGPATLPAVASRGCAFRCAFCTSNPGETRAALRTLSLERLGRDLRELKERHGARRVALLDACANHDPKRFEALLELVEELGLGCEFPNGLRADRLSLRALKALKRSSSGVTVSAESGDPEVLSRRIKKGLDLEAVERVARRCRRLRLPLAVHYVVGVPGETPATINRTLAHALRLKEDEGVEPLIQNFVPIPGTPLHGQCARQGLLGGFDPERLYAYFQGTPALDLPGLSAAALERMRALYERRAAAGRPEKVIMNLTYRCNNDCSFCAVGDRAPRDGDLARYARLLRGYRARGLEALDIDGGEPTLHPGLLPFLRLARELGFRALTLTTNGRRLADRGFAARLLLSGLSDLLVSLHGPTAQVHDGLTRRPGSYEQTVAGLRHAVRLKPARLRLAVNTMLLPENQDRLSDLFGFAYALGVEKVNVQLLTPFGRAAAAAAGDEAALLRTFAQARDLWRGKVAAQLINALPCRARELGAGLDLGKHSREMVFVDAPPRNLAAYLDVRRRKGAECGACEDAVACAGPYVYAGAA